MSRKDPSRMIGHIQSQRVCILKIQHQSKKFSSRKFTFPLLLLEQHVVSSLKFQHLQPEFFNSAVDFHTKARGKLSRWLMVLRPKNIPLNYDLFSRTRNVCCHPLLGSQHLTHSCAIKLYSTELKLHMENPFQTQDVFYVFPFLLNYLCSLGLGV